MPVRKSRRSRGFGEGEDEYMGGLSRASQSEMRTLKLKPKVLQRELAKVGLKIYGKRKPRKPTEYNLFVKKNIKNQTGTPQQKMKAVAMLWRA